MVATARSMANRAICIPWLAGRPWRLTVEKPMVYILYASTVQSYYSILYMYVRSQALRYIARVPNDKRDNMQNHTTTHVFTRVTKTSVIYGVGLMLSTRVFGDSSAFCEFGAVTPRNYVGFSSRSLMPFYSGVSSVSCLLRVLRDLGATGSKGSQNCETNGVQEPKPGQPLKATMGV